MSCGLTTRETGTMSCSSHRNDVLRVLTYPAGVSRNAGLWRRILLAFWRAPDGSATATT
jgi:hypothetical protein